MKNKEGESDDSTMRGLYTSLVYDFLISDFSFLISNSRQ